MSEWTSLQDILADLSEAQGCVVPSSLQAIGSTEVPRNLRESEDNMMAEYHHEVSVKPDLHMIQEMLHLVNGMGDTQEHQVANTFKQNCKRPDDNSRKLERNNRKLKKNVALTSIIEAKERKEANDKLTVIPPMFRKKTDAEKKVIIDSRPQPQTEEYKPSPLAAEYYKKYLENNERGNTSSSEYDVDSDYSMSNTPSSSCSPAKHSQEHTPKAYVPTADANNYYRKLVLREKLREQAKEDIWAQAEREMKKIDHKKKLADALSPQDPQQAGLCTVSLVDHRHLLAEECVVCEVAAKHGYKFEDNDYI